MTFVLFVSRLVSATITISRIIVCGVHVGLPDDNAYGKERVICAKCDASAARAADCAPAKVVAKESKGGGLLADTNHGNAGHSKNKGEHEFPDNNTIRASTLYHRNHWSL